MFHVRTLLAVAALLYAGSASAQTVAGVPRAAFPDVPQAPQARLPPPPAAPTGVRYGYARPWTPMPVAPQHDAPRPAPTRTTSYGYQTLIADGASLGMVLAGGGSESDGMIALGGIGYLVAAPIVHVVHGRVGIALADAGLRVALPIGFAYAGAALERCSPGEELCGVGGAVMGAFLGVGAAVTLDATLLAREQVRAEPAPALAIAPMLGKDRGGVAVSGTF